MVMDDPDLEYIDDDGIDIFDPASIEREVSIGSLLGTTIGAFGVMFAAAVILIFPIMAAGLITMNPTTLQVNITSTAMLILSIAEIGFIIPPYYYIKKRNQKKESLGIKNFSKPIEIGFGLLVGILMLVANIIVTYFLADWTGASTSAEDQMFSNMNLTEVILWVIVMFTIVGFSEELLFRGFLQKRMELYFKRDYKQYKFLALVFTSFIFALMHLDLIGLPTRFMLGMFLGYLAQERNYSIMGPTVAHGFNNAAVVVFAFLGF